MKLSTLTIRGLRLMSSDLSAVKLFSCIRKCGRLKQIWSSKKEKLISHLFVLKEGIAFFFSRQEINIEQQSLYLLHQYHRGRNDSCSRKNLPGERI